MTGGDLRAQPCMLAADTLDADRQDVAQIAARRLAELSGERLRELAYEP
jgi:histidine ammonia-lyase